jgi:hypothetical protein
VVAASERTLRRYRMFCRRCGGTWDAAYDVVSFHDVEGDQELFYLHGLPAMAPWSGVSCPTCGDQRATILPFRDQAPDPRAKGRAVKEESETA